MMRRVLREPLVQFVLAGALLFTAYGLAGWGGTEADKRIVVRAADIEGLAATWRQQWGRAPTREELKRLIEAHVRDEILYREALALGLDRNDTIVRRRLMQKMEFIGEGVVADDAPPAAELERFFRAEAERYREPAKVSFSHVYFSRDRRGERAEPDARAALRALRSPAGDTVDGVGLGDPFLLRSDYAERSQRDVGEIFGAPFAGAVFQLEPGAWQGPIESAYGVHLVRVRKRSESRLPALEAIRPRVLADWRERRRKEANGDFYAQLRARYDVELDDDALAGAAEGE
jgi:peptidyl-prolyl cis-trans isomerase C